MSKVDSILDAIQAAAKVVIPALTTSREAKAISELPADQYPHLILLHTAYAVDALEFGHENQQWRISGTLAMLNQTREELGVTLEAIGAELYSDPQLNNEIDRLIYTSAVPETASDATRGYGIFEVEASWVFGWQTPAP